VNRAKKLRERTYLDAFLRLSRRKAKVIETERPDFVLVAGGSRTGVEVTEVLRRDEGAGSTLKRKELNNQRALTALATKYYEAGGRPLQLHLIKGPIPHEPQADAFVRELARVRESMAENEQRRDPFGDREDLGTLHVRALPDSFVRYNRWQFVDDVVGWVETLEPARLTRIIENKSRKLTAYRRGVAAVELLIVAEKLKNSGKWRLPDDFVPLDPRGFDAVHLLLHPDELHRVA
jgi:hypothetical protein